MTDDDLTARARELAEKLRDRCCLKFESAAIRLITAALRAVERETLERAFDLVDRLEVDYTKYSAARYEEGIADGLDRAAEAIKQALKELESRNG